MIFKPSNKCEIFRIPLESDLQFLANQIEENCNSTFFWYVTPYIVNTNVTHNEYIVNVIYKKKLKLLTIIILLILAYLLFSVTILSSKLR